MNTALGRAGLRTATWQPCSGAVLLLRTVPAGECRAHTQDGIAYYWIRFRVPQMRKERLKIRGVVWLRPRGSADAQRALEGPLCCPARVARRRPRGTSSLAGRASGRSVGIIQYLGHCGHLLIQPARHHRIDGATAVT